nr:hypothetical protein [Tanacetum cinerariifolium]
QPCRTFATIINRSLSGKITGLDKLRLSRAQILWGMYYKNNVDYVELLWEDFTYPIDNRGHKKQKKMYYPRFTKVIIHYFLAKDKTISKINKIGMHTSRDNYLINILRFVFVNEEFQIYGAQLPKSMIRPEMRETKAYKTFFGYATEPTRKSKRVKRLAKKSTNAPIVGVVIKDTLVMSLSKKKEKLHVLQRSNLLSQMKELVYQRSGGSDKESDSGDDNSQSEKEKGSDSEHEIDENESCSESDQEENQEDVEDEKDDEFVKTPSNSTDEEDETNVESKVKDKVEGGEDKGMDYTTNQKEGSENMEITLNQVIKDAHVTISTVAKKTEVPVTSSSHSSDLASKFLIFLDIPHTDSEIISPLDVHVHQEVPSKQTPTLLTVHVSVITKSSPVFTTVIP